MNIRKLALSLAVISLPLSSCSQGGGGGSGQSVEILNVSYDPTRELYQALNTAFAAKWKAEQGQKLNVRMSHGGSGKQARSVVDGLPADVVTLALGYDVDAIADAGKLPLDWQKRLPHNSSPYTSTIVLLVRKDNPKNIRDWGDLVRRDVKVITPNPKTSGGARWNFLAAWAYGRKAGGSEQGAEDFVRRVYANVPVLDSGARGSTTTFVERGIGDVLIAWENEAFLAMREQADKFEIVTPSISILAEPPVAVVDANAETHKTEQVAKAYLEFLYTPQAQQVIADNFYRPRDTSITAKGGNLFKVLPLVTVDADFGGWRKAQKLYFDDGGVFDRILARSR